ncbi:hypothetical protein D791_02756 [Nitrincola nitratireducens]|uniref:Uncharacterized protein n=1 Tax=Nitrincola nitratireducens TaxID=1229521 RepID=W9USI9_9GAMM|nr:hypothetical protein D791_02756 [Nitrincola nitratireducens]
MRWKIENRTSISGLVPARPFSIVLNVLQDRPIATRVSPYPLVLLPYQLYLLAIASISHFMKESPNH